MSTYPTFYLVHELNRLDRVDNDPNHQFYLAIERDLESRVPEDLAQLYFGESDGIPIFLPAIAYDGNEVVEMKIIIDYVLTRTRHIRKLNTATVLCGKNVSGESVRNLRPADLTDKSVCQECRNEFETKR